MKSGVVANAAWSCGFFSPAVLVEDRVDVTTARIRCGEEERGAPGQSGEEVGDKELKC
jgi:hypothetical protein